MEKTLTVKKEKLYSFIWIVPLVALIIAASLIYQTHFNKGPQITLILSKADGIEAGKTTIKALSVVVGKVQSISLSPDRKNVIAEVQMDRGTEDLINEDAKFWIQKVRIDREGVSGLDTILSGYYIELEPGKSKHPRKLFTVLDEPPFTPDSKGLYINLYSKSSKKVSEGDTVKFKGIDAGKILDANYDFEKNRMMYRVFIAEPFSKLINSHTEFWISSGISFSMGPNGLKVDTDSLENIVAGGISFDNLEENLMSELKPAKNDDTFLLHANRFDLSPTYDEDRTLNYVVLLKKPERGIQKDSPVFFKGVQVGVVKKAPYFPKDYRLFHDSSDYSPVLLTIQQERFEKSTLESIDTLKEDITDLIKNKNLTASVESMNLFTGQSNITLSIGDGKAVNKNRIIHEEPYDGYTVIPSMDSDFKKKKKDIGIFAHNLATLPLKDLSDNVNRLLTNFQNTSGEVQALTANLNAIVNKLQKENVSGEMVGTLKQIQNIMGSYSADSAFYQDLSTAIKELNTTMKGLQPVVRKVDEKTNSLVFSYDRGDPIPQGSNGNKEK